MRRTNIAIVVIAVFAIIGAGAGFGPDLLTGGGHHGRWPPRPLTGTPAAAVADG